MSTRTERLEMRLRPEDKRTIERAAAVSGLPISQFVLLTTVKHAARVLARHERTLLRGRDRDAFLRILDEDARPADALVDAVGRHSSEEGRAEE